MYENLYPYNEIKHKQDNVFVGVTKNGGHCSWIAGYLLPYIWYPQPMAEFLDFLHNLE